MIEDGLNLDVEELRRVRVLGQISVQDVANRHADVGGSGCPAAPIQHELVIGAVLSDEGLGQVIGPHAQQLEEADGAVTHEGQGTEGDAEVLDQQHDGARRVVVGDADGRRDSDLCLARERRHQDSGVHRLELAQHGVDVGNGLEHLGRSRLAVGAGSRFHGLGRGLQVDERGMSLVEQPGLRAGGVTLQLA